MTALPSEIESGEQHALMLRMAGDAQFRISTLPELMNAILKADGWKRLIRPIDKRAFENRTIADWILGEPWSGLGFPDWATLYGILEHNLLVGAECIARLRAAGAPARDIAEQQFQVNAATTRPDAPTKADAGATGGRGHKATDNIRSFTVLREYGTDPVYLARRLKRDAAQVFAAFQRGEYRSVRAAAIAAGLLREKTPLDQLRHWWRKAPEADRRAFRIWIDSG